MEEGKDDSARVAVWIHAPETFFVFGIFIRGCKPASRPADA
jgi:hypothetical protein